MNAPLRGFFLSGMLIFSFSVPAFAQAHKTKSTAVPPKTVAPAVAKGEASAPAAGPSEDEAKEFLRRMFGYDPNVTWTIQGISPTDAPGVSHVVAMANIGGQPRPFHLYVLPGGKFAAVGDLIPFGADPFAPVREALASKGKGVKRGPATAPVTLVEFSDLQCPFCRSAQPIIDRLVAEVPSAKLIFQPFPLNIHPWAMKAASYAECAARQKPEAFWTFVNGVYDDQANITDADVDAKLQGIAAAAGVDGAKVSTCAGAPDVYQRIQQSIELGKSVGVGSTPTLFINGRKITGIADIPYEQLKAMVEFEVAESQKK
ncbi:MAG TPA: thioredoxin domain-containing protein [Terriglobales bacterium]|nr:thioredoxin domain-containing protein [Terriglobales bacterium]